MADSMSVNTSNVDLTKWRKLTPQEIIKEESKGEEIPAEIIAWAQQMAAFAKIPDNVTYEQVDGDIGIDALNKLGIEDEQQQPPAPVDENAIPPEETETADAVGDVENAEEIGAENPDNIFMNPVPGEEDEDVAPPDKDDEDVPDEVSGLADSDLTADSETIRKRKERKGLPQ